MIKNVIKRSGRWLLFVFGKMPQSLQYFIGTICANTIRPYTFRDGRSFRRYWDDFCRTEHASREELENLQWRKFKMLLDHAYKNVKYYRNRFNQAGITPDDIKSFKDLEKIPILTKEDIRNHFDELIADGAKKEDLIVHETGGSTGTPLKFYWDKQCYIAVQSAYARWKKFAGCNVIKDKYVYIGRHDFREGSDGSDFLGEYNPLANQLKLASANMSPKVLEKYVEKVRKFKPKYIQGYASGVYVLASYIYENGIDGIKVDAVLTSSDTLYPKYREIIEEVFGCKVFDRYGLGEEVTTAVECEEHNGMHIDMEKCIVEVIDDNDKQIFEETGEIIGTNLENYAMPLIRYWTNDLGQISLRKCSCGRESKKLFLDEGRKDDILLTPSGRKIGSAGLSVILKKMTKLVECQFIQETPEKVTVLSVWSKNYSEEDLIEFKEKFNAELGKELLIDLKVVNKIPRTRGGKFKFIISEVER